MKIIGGKDYYDGAGYGVDDTCVFVRQDKRYISDLDHTTNHPFKLLPILNRHVKSSNSVSISPFYHVIAGELTPGFMGRKNGESISGSKIDFIYSEDELRSFFSEFSDPLPKSIYLEGDIVSGQKKIISLYAEHLKAKIQKSQLDWLIKNHVTVMTVYWSKIEKTKRSSAIINHANLKDFEVYRVHDPATIHMRIANYISGVLPFNTEIVELSDRDKVKKAGFDVRRSFRKAPEGER